MRTPEQPQQPEANPRVSETEIDDENVGEIVVEKGDRNYIADAVKRIKATVSDAFSGTRPLINGRGQIVDANPAALTTVEQLNWQTLEKGRGGVRALRQLWREAAEKRAQALNILQRADERLASIRRLAAADGHAKAYALFGTPKPAGPERPPMTRIRALAPWVRIYHPTVSNELATWLLVNEDVDDPAIRYPERDYRSAGRGHCFLLPTVLTAELFRAGLAEPIGDEVPLQWPDGRRI
jgi:hypothetical protein